LPEIQVGKSLKNFYHFAEQEDTGPWRTGVSRSARSTWRSGGGALLSGCFITRIGNPDASKNYRAVRERHGITCSSRRDNCFDNAAMESSIFGFPSPQLLLAR
jgi:hypothetical protein